MQYKYFYRLGHQESVSLAEAAYLGLKIEYNYQNWMFSNQKISLEKTGSLVFSGTVEKMWATNYRLTEEEFYKVLEEAIMNFQKTNPTKIAGLVVPFKWQKKCLLLAKKAGLKKVNIQTIPTIPNYGHWKQAKVWWILVQEQGHIWLGRIEQMANQEFWSNLDMKLPKGDMARGIINMKFARTLLNLTTQKIIWDPFAGHGRLVLAGLDLKDKFYASDINEEKLNDEITENYDFALKMYNQEFLRTARISHSKSDSTKTFDEENITPPLLGSLEKVFRLDAKFISSVADKKALTFQDGLSAENFKEMAIVTEGYLGFNFKGQPLPIQTKTEWENIEKIWQSLLAGAGKLGIAEVIGCVPFYQIDNKKVLPPFVSKLEGIGGYKLEFLDEKRPYLEYARPQAHVGHLVVKFVL